MRHKFLLPLLSAFPLMLAARNFDITEYGAVSDTTLLSTSAIQRAIDECSKAGGGRVTMPTGDFKTGSLFLKNNVHLYLEEGATLYGSTDIGQLHHRA